MAPNNNKENQKTSISAKKKRTPKLRPGKKVSPRVFEDSISKSKQLIQKTKTIRSPRPTRKVSRKEPRIRLCGNGQPMPSLAELEKMFEDDSDDEVNVPLVTVPDRCKTPEQPIIIDDLTSITPNTIEKISNKMMEYIINLTDDLPPLPVVPQKRRKRKNSNPSLNEVQVVTCDAPESRLPAVTAKKPRVCVGKSHENYGVDYSLLFNQQELEDTPPEASHYTPVSHSIFNPKSSEIADMLKDDDNLGNLSDSSGDSNKTVPYELTHSPIFMSRSFSPLPSTSTDTETIMKNEALLNESLKSIKANRSVSIKQGKSSEDTIDVTVIPSLPCETVIIDDELPEVKNVADAGENDVQKVKSLTLPATVISADDIYSTIIIDDDYQPYDKDECEVIDIDEIIASNKNVLNKFKDDNVTITHVKPCVIQSANNESEPNTTNKESTDASKTSKKILHTLTDSFVQLIKNSNYNSMELVHQITELVGHESKSIIRDICDSLIECAASYKSAFTNKNMSAIANTMELHMCTEVLCQSINILNNCVSIANAATNILEVQTVLTDALCNKNTSNITTIELDSSINSVQTSNDSLPIDFPTPSSVSPVEPHDNIPQNINTVTSIPSTPVRKPAIICSSTPISLISPSTPVQKSSAPVRNIGECPICMDSLGSTAIASTICGHIFCANCIKAAIRANGKKCPTCRKKLTGVGFHPLFL